jgi:hypothetical protein
VPDSLRSAPARGEKTSYPVQLYMQTPVRVRSRLAQRPPNTAISTWAGGWSAGAPPGAVPGLPGGNTTRAVIHASCQHPWSRGAPSSSLHGRSSSVLTCWSWAAPAHDRSATGRTTTDCAGTLTDWHLLLLAVLA